MRARIPAALRDPLLRNGHLLTLSSAITGAFGVLYWSLAARRYGTLAVGRGSSAVSALMLISGLASLNLTSTLIRFLPTQGSRARRLVLGTYAVSVAAALALSVAFVALAGSLSRGLSFFGSSPRLMFTFIVAAVLWTVSTLQDAALTGTRDTGWVVAENAAMAMVKAGLVVVLASVIPDGGILVSWTLGLAVSGLLANAVLFGWSLPRHGRQPVTETLPLRDLVAFAVPDYVGSVLWLGAIAGLPLFVVAKVGASTYAYFGVAWAITIILYQASSNLGYSLTVEAAGDEMAVSVLWMRMVRHVGPVLVVAVIAMVAGAPLLLRPFGASYATHGTTVLRLLVISALPNLVTMSAVSAARARRRTGVALAILGSLCAIVVAASLVLLPVMGIDGVGWAWLVAQSVIAAAVMIFRRVWLAPPGKVAVASQPAGRPGEAAAACGALADLLASGGTRVDPSRLTLAPALRVKDMAIATLAWRGEPIGVLKQPVGALAAARLRAEHQALEAIHRDERFRAWRSVVPRAQLIEGSSGVSVVQTAVPGHSGQMLLRGEPETVRALLGSVFTGYWDLQLPAATPVVVDSALLGSWVDESLEVLAGVAGRSCLRAPATALTRLRVELQQTIGEPALVSWVHGDLCVDNVRCSERGTMTGIADWTEAREQNPVDLDACTLALTAWATLTGRSMGAVTVRCLRVGGWTGLASGHLGVSRRLLAPRTGLDERSVVLLSWLRHVAMNVARLGQYGENPVWLRSNVGQVLRELRS